MSNINGSNLKRSEEMGSTGEDSLLKSLIDEIQNLRGIVNPLKQEVKMLQDRLAENEKGSKDKISIADLYDSSDYKDQKFNVAAMTMILHKKSAQEWQQADLADCAEIYERIHDKAHYLGFGKSKERIVNKDGSFCNSYMLVLRKYLVLGAECSAAQGKEIQRLLFKMFVPVKSGEGEQTSVRIDPVRQSFRKYIAEVCFGRLVNPHIPRQTGLSSQDYNVRIEIIAEHIRRIFFGTKHQDSFACLRADGTNRRVELPTKDVIIEEIKQKFGDREWAEIRYIKSYLKVFDAYELARSKDEVEEEDDHERSRPIIETWKDTHRLKGYVVLNNEATPPSSRRDVSNGLLSQSSSSGYSQFSDFSMTSSSQTTNSSRSCQPGYSLSSSSSSNASKKRPYNTFFHDSPSQENVTGSQHPDSNHMYDHLDENEEDEYAQPPKHTVPSQKLQRQGKDREATYVRRYNEDQDVDEESKREMEMEEEEETEEDSPQHEMSADEE